MPAIFSIGFLSKTFSATSTSSETTMKNKTQPNETKIHKSPELNSRKLMLDNILKLNAPTKGHVTATNMKTMLQRGILPPLFKELLHIT